MSTKEQVIHDAISAIERALNKALNATLPKVMSQVFDAGGADYAASLQLAMKTLNPIQFVGQVEFTEILPGETAGTPGKDGRAPRGAVRQAVTKALMASPEGLSLSAVGVAALEIDPSISIGGVNNEISRQKDVRYTNASGLWKLTDETLLAIAAGEGDTHKNSEHDDLLG